MKIDFVSDVSCPWCAVGLHALESALARFDPPLPVTLHFQPFELNPQMAAEGEDIGEHLARKYGLSETQLAANREALRQRGESVASPSPVARAAASTTPSTPTACCTGPVSPTRAVPPSRP